MKIDGACAHLKEIVEGPTKGGTIEVLRTKNAGFLLPRLGEVKDRRGETRYQSSSYGSERGARPACSQRTAGACTTAGRQSPGH